METTCTPEDTMTVTFTAEAHTNGHFHARATSPELFPTKEDAQAFAAAAPKGIKLRGTRLTRPRLERDDPEFSCTDTVTVGYVDLTITFASNGVTGEVNEGGIRRYRQFRKFLAARGYEMVFSTRDRTAMSEAEFEASLIA